MKKKYNVNILYIINKILLFYYRKYVLFCEILPQHRIKTNTIETSVCRVRKLFRI